MAAPDCTPTYLIELMDPHLGNVVRVDVTAYLENAIQLVFSHLADFHEPVEVEVTIDPASGHLSGIVVFSEEEQAISVIRAFYLERDEVECEKPDILDMVGQPLSKLEPKLNQLFKKR